MRREKCPHGIYFYPGIAEKEKCCGVCRNLVANTVGSEPRLEASVPLTPKPIPPVPKVIPPVPKPISPAPKLISSVINLVPKPVPSIPKPVPPITKKREKPTLKPCLIVDRDTPGAYTPKEDSSGTRNTKGTPFNLNNHHMEVMKKGQSQYYGVYWADHVGLWVAKPRAYPPPGKTDSKLGHFVSAEAAAEAVNEHLRKHNPDDPRINVIRSEPTPKPKWGKVRGRRCYGINRRPNGCYMARMTDKQTKERHYFGIFNTLLEAGRVINAWLAARNPTDYRIMSEDYLLSPEAELSLSKQ